MVSVLTWYISSCHKTLRFSPSIQVDNYTDIQSHGSVIQGVLVIVYKIYGRDPSSRPSRKRKWRPAYSEVTDITQIASFLGSARLCRFLFVHPFSTVGEPKEAQNISNST